MSIQEPYPKLSDADKRIIFLIAEVLAEGELNDEVCGNVGRNFSLLSDERAKELLHLLEILMENKDFREKIAFVEGIGFGHDHDDKWKKLFFKKSGRRAVQSTQKWEAYKRRLWGSSSGYFPGANTRYMEFEHFYKMEERLFATIGIDPRVRSLLMKTIHLVKEDVERHRREKLGAVKLISDALVPIIRSLRDDNLVKGGVAMSNSQLSGLATLVSNCSILFTTRDWGIAGTISTMAGGLAILSK